MRTRCRHHLAHAHGLLERTQQTSLYRLRTPQTPPKWSCTHRRCYATEAQLQPQSLSAPAQDGSHTLAVPSEARYNEIGVQYVSRHMHEQLFPPRKDGRQPPKPDQELIELSKKHLAQHDLLGKTSDTGPPIAFNLPPLQGETLDEHFYRLGMESADDYLKLSKRYAIASPPPKPRKWMRRSGWTKYYPDGTEEAIPSPDADVLTFDVEVIYHETSFPAMACAVSADHWYAWLSPWLLGESDSDRHLIPLGDPTKKRIVVGHNIGYDRARIKEEYSLTQSRNFFIDTMSLHVAVNGMCSRQRPSWTKARKAREFQDKLSRDDEYEGLGSLVNGSNSASGSTGGLMEEEEEPWVGRSSANSLRDVAKFHCGISIDKSRREWFGELDREGVLERYDELLDYCAADVDVTHKVYKKVFSNFLETCPHPVSFAALRHLSTCILPVDKGWDEYITNAEATYQRMSKGVEERLVGLAEKAVGLKEEAGVYEKDPWLRQMDWGGQEVRMTKAGRPAARQKKAGMPRWYKELFAKEDSAMAITVRTRVAPLLLRLAWDGWPLVWSGRFGWTFRVPGSKAAKYAASMTEADMSDDPEISQLGNAYEDAGEVYRYFKLPHPDGPAARCASPMAKGYLQYFESGVLGSEGGDPYAREALDMNAGCSYWISARDRIRHQMVVRQREVDDPASPDAPAADDNDLGFILPQIIPMGTITRRAVENTWLTAANAKSNRVGSELKSIITAPPGYSFVGADVDSQELWIASLVGDAAFGLHGGGALGFMTLEGTKTAGTDLHSRTAGILGIKRDEAKVFNYGRIYGAGVKFAQTLLRRFNTGLSEQEAEVIARELYRQTKGTKVRGRKGLRGGAGFWCGGSESLVFNGLEGFAQEERPRTPVLGAGITEALRKRYLGSGNGYSNNTKKDGGVGGGSPTSSSSPSSSYLTSRINWAIQSSGVDYLHLLILAMEHLCTHYAISARLALTVHDEIRYLATTPDRYRCALALQIANVWTRAFFSEQMGIHDLPQACAWFSAVDVDFVLRKEVDMGCVTPSHPEAILAGESLGIGALLAKGEGVAGLGERVGAGEEVVGGYGFVERVPVMEGLAGRREEGEGRVWLRAQIAGGRGEVDEVLRGAGTGGKGSSARKTGKSETLTRAVEGKGGGGGDGGKEAVKVRRQRVKAGKDTRLPAPPTSQTTRANTARAQPKPKQQPYAATTPPFDEWGLLRSMNRPHMGNSSSEKKKAWPMDLGLGAHHQNKGWPLPGKVAMSSAGVGRG
ncbi:DNA-directed DNA polymerase gamma mip1 [Friedmanniomyces endolithicus]|nr:DNA-directed DNA polymerase gamma mip1 [Friedmanniomyces endolithicus]